MYTKEQEEIALKAYERLGSVHAVIRRLEYPSESTLYCWYERRNAGLENKHGHAAVIPEKSDHQCNTPDHPRHPPAEFKYESNGIKSRGGDAKKLNKKEQEVECR